ncbi:MAG: NAD(+)/NADH kinase [Halobacteriaceae archaeon]
MRVGIVAQLSNSRAAYLAADVGEMLAERGVERWYDEETAAMLDAEGTPTEEFGRCDLVVSIGGDGTFLYAARNAETTPVLGVNLGEVGFLNAVAPEEAVAAVGREVDRFETRGDVRSRPVPRVVASGPGWSLSPGLNEVVVQGPQRGRGQGCSVEVRVDGSLYTGTHADGVLVATPTGSTAYNLSEGGPLVYPGVSALAVTAMAPTEATPSLVVGQDDGVTLRVDDAPRAHVAVDGSVERTVTPPTQVTVELAAEPARVAGPPVEFFQALGKLE